MTTYYRWIIVDSSGAEVSRDYPTKKIAEDWLEAFEKKYGKCRIKKKRYQYY